MAIAPIAPIAALIQFRRAHTTVDPHKPETTTTLVTSGVYAWTRNPMYLGLSILLLGWAIKLGALTPLVSVALSAAGAQGAESGRVPQSDEVLTPKPDGLNPPGIRTAGIRMVPVVGGRYKVWTKKIGAGRTKVLLLHGGPGFSHDYLEAMESFLPQAGIEMYYYDQLGCNNSDQPDDASLWTLERYTEEVEEVRRALGLEHFVLYGHS